MDKYSLSHLSDHALELDLTKFNSHEFASTATLLAHIAEFDARHLYLPAAYPSTHAYCVQKLHRSDDSAYKHITAARAVRRFPAIFQALAEGRLHLAAIGQLSPHLTPDNAADLLKAASHKTKSEIAELLAQRFPRSEMLPLVTTSSCQLAPGRVQVKSQGAELAPVRVDAIAPLSRVAPIAAQRFELYLSIGQGTRDKLQYIQSLLGHQADASDLARIVDRSFDAYIVELEKRKFAATARPQRKPRPTAGRRHIPAHIKRTVWQRDGGRCTFVSEAGKRCPARTRLETLWNDGLAVVTSSCLREEKPTAVARGHLDRGLAPAAPEPHTRGARRERERYHLRRHGRTQEGDQRGHAAARTAPAGRVATGQ